MEKITATRLKKWLSQRFPFGSEFPWDNTGHEEILSWLHYYGHEAEANSTAAAVLAYTTLQPHYAYSGSSRRWWDFFINGKESNGNERVLHHYASGLNAVALMLQYMSFPLQNGHLLRTALAGVSI